MLWIRKWETPLGEGSIPELLFGSQRGEAGFTNHMVYERDARAHLRIRCLAKLAVVREAVVDLLGVLVMLPQDILPS